jgi:prepilin-type N-terminal cleavage/methylation domain-containing protein
MLNKSSSYSQGFTLVELLIVITILATLLTTGYIQFYGLNAKARNSARRADLYEVATALEVNKIPTGYIPLEATQFSSFQWKDPVGDSYCIGIGNIPNPAVSSAWGENCPSGYLKVEPGVPGGGFLKWKVCTFLESPEDASKRVFCRSSSQ